MKPRPMWVVHRNIVVTNLCTLIRRVCVATVANVEYSFVLLVFRITVFVSGVLVCRPSYLTEFRSPFNCDSITAIFFHISTDDMNVALLMQDRPGHSSSSCIWLCLVPFPSRWLDRIFPRADGYHCPFCSAAKTEQEVPGVAFPEAEQLAHSWRQETWCDVPKHHLTLEPRRHVAFRRLIRSFSLARNVKLFHPVFVALPVTSERQCQ